MQVTASDVAHFSQFKLNRNLSEEARTLLRHIFAERVQDRLGCGSRGWSEIKSHPWFRSVDWEALAMKGQKGEGKEFVLPDAPIRPDPNRANCTPNADLQDQLLDFKPQKVPDEDQVHFRGFGFNNTIRSPPLVVSKPGAQVPVDASKAPARTLDDAKKRDPEMLPVMVKS